MLIEIITLTVIILLYPLGFLAGFARGRRVKVLDAIGEMLRRDDGAADQETD